MDINKIKISFIILISIVVIIYIGYSAADNIPSKFPELFKDMKKIMDSSLNSNNSNNLNNKLLSFIKDSENISKFSGEFNYSELVECMKNIGISTYIKEVHLTDFSDDNIHCNKNETIFYYINTKWKFSNGFLLKDLENNKYLIPEGLIKINKNSSYLWEKYTGGEPLEVYKFVEARKEDGGKIQ